MKKTKAPGQTPSPANSFNSDKVGGSSRQTYIFVSMALDMSWRLALVVWVPIIGGFELDKRWSTTPLLTIVGIVVATAGVALVMRRTLQVANKLAPVSKESRS